MALLFLFAVVGPFPAAVAANVAPSFSLPTSPLGQAGATWVQQPNSLFRQWKAVAVSADGIKAAAVVYPGYIYTTTDFGVTWTARMTDANRSWAAIASSADGTKLAAVANNGWVYTSSNAGVVWTASLKDANRYWKGISSSEDGSRLVAVNSSGEIYISANSGATWTQTSPVSYEIFQCAASSTDGMKVLVGSQGYLYTSTDGGATWASRSVAGQRNWTAVTSSADGTRLAATEYGGQIYTSADSGVTWTARATDAARRWYGITSSADGLRLAANTYMSPYISGPAGNAEMYTSADGGVTWTLRTNDLFLGWNAVASSADGTRLMAVMTNGYINTSAGPYLLIVPTLPAAYSQAGFATGISPGPAADTGQTVSFTVTNDNNALFSVQPAIDSTGGLTFTTIPGQVGIANVTVVAKDNGGTASGGKDTSATQVFQIFVPIYSVPTDVTLSSTSMLASTPVKTVVGTLTAISPNPLDTYMYTLVAGTGNTDNSRFSIVGNSLILNTAITPPMPSSFSIRVRATDYGGATFEKAFVIAVIYVNHAPSFSLPTATAGTGGYPWTARLTAKSRKWADVASSADGTRIAAVTADGGVYLSSDYGTTWIKRQPVVAGGSGGQIACSADGTKLVVAMQGQPVYTSSDSGLTWAVQLASGSYSWNSMCMSADGTRLAAAGGGYLYTSSDAGATWAVHQTDSIRSWSDIASSADGTRLAAVHFNGQFGQIFASEDSGATWNVKFSSSKGTLIGIALSADGTKWVASVREGQLYTSTNSGAGWVTRMADANRYWWKVASSADGTRLVASTNGPIYLSYDSGISWTAQASGSRPWVDVTSSADGTKLAAVDSNGYLYTSSNLSPLSVAGNSGPWSQAGFATALSPGGLAEADQIFGFTVTNSNPALFSAQPAIDSSGKLTFTPAPNVSGTAVLSVILKDNGGTANGGVDTSAPQQFLLIITPNHSPTDVALSTANVLENNAPGAVAATLSATDADLVNPMTFTLEEGQGDTDNGYFAITGNSLRLTMVAKWEIQNSFSLRVRATNAAGGYFEKVLTLSVINVNEPPLFSIPASPAESWIPRDSNRNWKAVACSADAVNVAAVVNGGYIYISADSGVTWTPRETDANRSWTAITISADGTKLVAVTSTGEIHTSADSGDTWTLRVSGQYSWMSVACSVDGTKLIASDGGVSSAGGFLHTSTDSGVTWSMQLSAGQHPWRAVTSSADGVKLVAGFYEGQIFISTDSGATWAVRPNYSGVKGSWNSMASSANGSRLLAVSEHFSDLWVSRNSGWSWVGAYLGSSPRWTAAASSANGARLAAVSPGSIYLSQDFGQNWEQRMVGASLSWTGIACSADGTKMVAVTAGGQIYTSTPVMPYNIVQSRSSGAYSQTGFAFSISAPSYEVNQVSFLLTNSNPALFSVQPAIDSSGRLFFTHVAGTVGAATLTVVAKDDGGTANGGVDATPPRTFTIQFVDPVIVVEQPAGSGLVAGVSSIDFGSVAPGASVVKTFVVRNTGVVNLSSLSMDRGGTGDFMFSVLGVTSLSPGASATFTVTFTPATVRTHNGVIHIRSNVVGSTNPFDVNLTGTGFNASLASWRTAQFGTATANTGNAEDFNHDGIPNSVEFAFGTNAGGGGGGRRSLRYTGTLAGGGTIGQTGQPVPMFEGGVLRVLFVRRKDYATAGLNYTPQFTSDLRTWQSSNVVPTILADDGTYQIVSVPYPVLTAGQKGKFLRVNVALAP